MKTYRIEITETLQKTIEIEASSDDEAINIVKSLYNKEEIVLDEKNYIDTEFNIIED